MGSSISDVDSDCRCRLPMIAMFAIGGEAGYRKLVSLCIGLEAGSVAIGFGVCDYRVHCSFLASP